MSAFFALGARWLTAAVVLCLAAAASAEAQSVNAPELKAAFLSNFAKFTDWPHDAVPAGSAFSYCVLEDKVVAAALRKILGDRPAQGGQPFGVRLVKLDPSIRTCQILYVGDLDGKDAAQLFAILKDAPVFTVGDAEGFAASGGVAQFIVDDRMRFAMNAAAAQRAHLAISSKLLSLATLVKDTQHDDR